MHFHRGVATLPGALFSFVFFSHDRVALLFFFFWQSKSLCISFRIDDQNRNIHLQLPGRWITNSHLATNLHGPTLLGFVYFQGATGPSLPSIGPRETKCYKNILSKKIPIVVDF